MTGTGEVAVAQLGRGDVERAVALLTDLRVDIAGTRSAAVYRAVCRDAAARRGSIAVLAQCGGESAGIAVVLVHPRSYWRSFAKRRPMLALLVAARRLRSRSHGAKPEQKHIASGGSAAADAVAPGPPPLPWTHAEPGIARLLFIGVVARYRGMGVSGKLFRAIAAALAEQGARAVDASIDKANLASLKAHRRAGWALYEDREHVYAFCDLVSQGGQ